MRIKGQWEVSFSSFATKKTIIPVLGRPPLYLSTPFSQIFIKNARCFLKICSKLRENFSETPQYLRILHLFLQIHFLYLLHVGLLVTHTKTWYTLSQIMVRSLPDPAVSEQTQVNERDTRNDHEQAHFSGG
jgi:hypothetical protein